MNHQLVSRGGTKIQSYLSGNDEYLEPCLGTPP